MLSGVWGTFTAAQHVLIQLMANRFKNGACRYQWWSLLNVWTQAFHELFMSQKAAKKSLKGQERELVFWLNPFYIV